MSLFTSWLRPKCELTDILHYGIFTDVESAGLNPNDHGILSVGACTAYGNETFYGRCHLYSFQNPQKAALRINGFTEDDCRDMELDSPHEMVRLFIEWVRKHVPKPASGLERDNPCGYIIGKNARWDYEMLRLPWDNVFKSDGPNPEPFPLSHRVIDLTTMAAVAYMLEGKRIPVGGIPSGELQAYLDMPDEPKPHNALTGATYNRDMLVRLLAKL